MRFGIIFNNDYLSKGMLSHNLFKKFNMLFCMNYFFFNSKTILPAGLIAEVTQKPPLFPVTFIFGVFPFFAHVFPRTGVKETPDSS